MAASCVGAGEQGAAGGGDSRQHSGTSSPAARAEQAGSRPVGAPGHLQPSVRALVPPAARPAARRSPPPPPLPPASAARGWAGARPRQSRRLPGQGGGRGAGLSRERQEAAALDASGPQSQAPTCAHNVVKRAAPGLLARGPRLGYQRLGHAKAGALEAAFLRHAGKPLELAEVACSPQAAVGAKGEAPVQGSAVDRGCIKPGARSACSRCNSRARRVGVGFQRHASMPQPPRALALCTHLCPSAGCRRSCGLPCCCPTRCP